MGATELTVFCAQLDPGATSPGHSHDREEVVALLEGTLEVVLDGRRETMAARDVLIIPAGAAHQVANATAGTATMLITQPSGTKFFAGDGTPVDPPPWTR